uniref:Hypothethical protein n=1 Tax=Ralstonia solanacearum PSI07 TaxID=859657 RepID=D8MYE3_RALSL|nr:hypothetical protein [Ralstonia solanacearum]CBJ34359.1 hypothethical protein [Ralstonia solanacearum PSI07]
MVSTVEREIPVKAYVVNQGGQLVATLENGVEIREDDPRVLADRLFEAGVRKEEVAMPDWRAGDVSPHAGVKIKLYARLAQLREL